MTEGDITALLADKHAKDVFVAGCKNGSTSLAKRLQILDAWALLTTWVRLTMIGYEIKTSRADFLSDKKWVGYLPLCNEFYFVCPPGVIQLEELPEHVGLLYTSKNATKLYTKRRAPYREIETPKNLLCYILMHRSGLVRDDQRMTGVEYWRTWLERQKEKREIGERVAYRIASYIRSADNKLKLAETLMERTEEIKSRLIENGINPLADKWMRARQIDEKVKQLSSVVPEGLIGQIKRMEGNLGELARQLQKIEERQP